jgi:hypothetical protein
VHRVVAPKIVSLCEVARPSCDLRCHVDALDVLPERLELAPSGREAPLMAAAPTPSPRENRACLRVEQETRDDTRGRDPDGSRLR